jgi:hypothetical protein
MTRVDVVKNRRLSSGEDCLKLEKYPDGCFSSKARSQACF